MNKAVLIGRIGKDAEEKKFDNGMVKATFPVATSEKRTNKEGEKVEQTEWHNIVAWGKLGEICAKYCKKGDPVCVEGLIRYSKWEQEGVTKYMTTIEATNVELLGRKPEAQTSETQISDTNDLPF